MGTFTDNLLKLTEFPFSYSLISLLALIRYGESFLKLPIETLGPLLIIIGFVATTLSITDPIGALQRLFLNIGFRWSIFRISVIDKAISFAGVLSVGYERKPAPADRIRGFWKIPIFGKPFVKQIHVSLMISLHPKFQDIFERNIENKNQEIIHPKYPLTPDNLLENTRILTRYEGYAKILNEDEIRELLSIIGSLQSTVLRSTWVGREIDKITAMGYFIIVISIFISAEFFIPGFLNNSFLMTSQDGNQTGDSDHNSTPLGTRANITDTNVTASTTPGDGLQARDIILLFSLLAVIGVSVMLLTRLKSLQSKARTAFQFLVEHDGLRIEEEKLREKYDKSLQTTERYITNGDWTLAKYWTKRVMNEYDDLIAKKWFEKKGTTAEKSKEVEKKIMITWEQKSDKLSIEEVKDVEDKVSSEDVENAKP